VTERLSKVNNYFIDRSISRVVILSQGQGLLEGSCACGNPATRTLNLHHPARRPLLDFDCAALPLSEPNELERSACARPGATYRNFLGVAAGFGANPKHGTNFWVLRAAARFRLRLSARLM
jgi:hypothetical protein